MIINELKGGIYYGLVESNHDPMQIGRCKIRVPEIDRNARTEDLQFTVPLLQTDDFKVPQILDLVYVMYINGDPDFPVYFGKVNAILKSSLIKGFTDRTGKNNIHSGLTDYPYNKELHNMGSEWIQEKGPTTPEESQLQLRMDPTITVSDKTLKGNTIVLDDTDNKEEIKIIDRLGQQIQMIANVSKALNLKNDEEGSNHNNRRIREESPLTNTKFQSIAKQHTSNVGIKLIDVHGQEINMGNIADLAYIELKSTSNHDREIYSSITLDKNSVSIRGVNNGVVHTKMEMTPDGLVIDASNIKFKAKDLTEIDSDVVINGSLFVKKHLMAERIIKTKEEDE